MKINHFLAITIKMTILQSNNDDNEQQIVINKGRETNFGKESSLWLLIV